VRSGSTSAFDPFRKSNAICCEKLTQRFCLFLFRLFCNFCPGASQFSQDFAVRVCFSNRRKAVTFRGIFAILSRCLHWERTPRRDGSFLLHMSHEGWNLIGHGTERRFNFSATGWP
jgi:hypothetical protein